MSTERAPKHRLAIAGALTAAVVTAVVTALAVTGLVLGHRIETRVADGVACVLPEGAEVSSVDLGARPLTVLVTRDVGDVHLSVEADAATVEGLLPGSEVAIADGVLSVSLSGLGIPATVALEPSLHEGDIRMTPQSVRVGGRTFSPDLFAERPGLGTAPFAPRDLGGPELPAGAELTSVDVEGDVLALEVDVAEDAVAALRDDPTTACS